MRSKNGIIGNGKVIVMLVASALVLSAPLAAWAKGGGGEKQKGGLPALEDRVEQNEGENNWAVVGSDGTLARSFSNAGAVTSTLTGTGTYDVTFGKDVSGCAYEATLGDVGTGAPAVGFIGVSSDAGDVDSVVVETFNNLGVATDESFHLYVSCPGHTGD